MRSVCALLFFIALVWSAPALACGGLFCAVPQGPTAPEPIDQNAERILFEIEEGAGTITAHVQIQYMGNPDSFAWVVPVPGVPEVGESSENLFNALDRATRLQVVLPPGDPCDSAPLSDTVSCGCSDGIPKSAAGSPPPVASPNDGPVTVYDSGTTNNYAYVVIGAERTEDLVTWLQENQYNVSENMTPVMDPYNEPADGDEGMRFLAIKLLDGKSSGDIVPLRFTYRSQRPVIPLRLTAVAAQPQMGVLVYISSDAPFTPGNFDLVEPDTDHLLLDAQNRSNYFDWVARSADEADGKRFVAEYVGPNPIRDTPMGGETLRGATLSRYYTRLSAHQMTEDPVFVPAPDTGLRVANVLDLSEHASLYRCGQVLLERLPSLCAFNYCGQGATCFESQGRAACQCPGDQVAQRILGPDGEDRVVCAPPSNAVGVTDEAAGVGSPFDPCQDISCGDGQCVVKGGFPSCACAQGAAASLREDGLVRCAPLPSDAPSFGPGGGQESAATLTAQRAPLRRAGLREAFSLGTPLLLVLGLLVALRRRNRLGA